MTKKNILLWQGRLSGRETGSAINSLESGSAKVVVLIRKPKKGVDQKVQGGPTAYIRDDLLKGEYFGGLTDATDAPYLVLKYALQDPSTVDIVHRKLGSDFFYGKMCLLDCLKNIDAIFQKHDVSAFVSYMIPHNVVGWLCAVYCSYYRIPHYYMRPTVVPNRAALIQDGVNPKIIGTQEFPQLDCPAAEEEIEKILDELRGLYEHFIPSYEKKRRQSRKGIGSDILKDAHDVLINPLAAKKVFSRRQAMAQVKSLASKNLKPKTGPSIAFFLHYQPERTTFPEAGYLSQQYIMASMLSQKALEIGGCVVVKEHPSQLLRNCGMEFRKADSYKRLANLKCVDFALPLSTPPEVIDRCDIVVTCGGSVMLEALARGRPVIYFNRIPFVRLHGVTHVSTYEELSLAIDDILSKGKNIDKCELKAGLVEIYKNSVPLSQGDTGSFSIELYTSLGKLI